jgi:DNA-3-methyladenine glycosylase I
MAECVSGRFGPEYLAYHDDEWGAAHGDDVLFERLTLEAFQSGRPG